MRWFTDVSGQARELGIGFLFVGVINNDPASVTSVLRWGNELQDKAGYWIILNEMQEVRSDFEYWRKSDAAIQFCKAFNPIITTLPSRSPALQGYLADYGLSLGKIAQQKSGVAELEKSRFVALARAYRSQLFREFDQVLPDLLPEV